MINLTLYNERFLITEEGENVNNDCVFCDKAKIEKRLVFENRNWYVAATLGQITDGGHILIIPKEHIICMGSLDEEQASEMLRVTREVCRALSLEYRCSALAAPYPVTIFEHGIAGQTIKHAHLHLLPTHIDLTAKIRSDFPEAEIEELQYAAHLQELYSKRPEPYLFWTVPSSKSMVCWKPSAPPQYLRLITAELLGRPERGNWRNMDADLDKGLCDDTVARLKSYFQRGGR